MSALTNAKTPDIVIEKISLARIDDYYGAFLESREEWINWGGFSAAYLSMSALEMMIKDSLEAWKKGTAYTFFILDTALNQVVGSASLNHINATIPLANLAYLVRKSRTGEGIATKAAMLVARYGFEQLGFQRIEIVVAKDNAASLKVAEKLGAVREGLLRNRLQLNGSLCDAYLHSLIPKDYEINQINHFNLFHIMNIVQFYATKEC
ncbi:MAG: GNAT family N-acetyltransferase [Ardenticatenaceae bacterium]|nr:GNAT family N-acetyltransferase [Ardenticatenaceae bacterium]